jgi:putative endopeptidase
MTFHGRLFIAAWLCGLAAVCSQAQGPANSSDAAPVEPKAPKMFDISAIDKSVDPCVNFYEYSCGNWRRANPVPADQPIWGRFNELRERTRWETYQILEKASADSAARTPLQRKYGDFFAACMNDEQANALGAKPIEPLLEKIGALKSTKELPALVAELQGQKATPVLFGYGSTQDYKDATKVIAELNQGGLGLPDRDYYTEQDARSKKIRTDYVAHMTAMFQLLGDSAEKAATEANAVMKLETALAEASQTRTAMREPSNTYHRMDVGQLKALAPAFDWDLYFEDIKSPAIENNLNVGSPEFFKAVNQAIQDQSLAAWQSYLRWHVVRAASPWLSKSFVDENFEFYGTVLSGQKAIQARWKRCSTLTDRLLGEAVGQDWVQQNFGGDAKANMEKLVAAMEKALGEDIQQLDWMTPATKAEAEKKLSMIRLKIGYPDKWRDYSSVMVKRDDLVGNIDRASAFELQRRLNKIGKPVDEKEWDMTPPTVNAYYEDSLNDINFPAGILQPPFYDNSADIAENLGGIGVVIGHEMTHGFDDKGSKFDGEGNLREWYTTEDRKEFVERTKCESAEYGNFEPVPGTKLNGDLTLGENTADNGGLRIAYLALMDVLAKTPGAVKPVDGYTAEQQFFISYGQLWCENKTDEIARLRAKTDSHSPGEFRVNGVVENFDAFGKAFGCKVGQPMMPQKSCRVW